MSMADPIADMLTRIRNANQRWQSFVDVPLSKLKLELAKKIFQEGFVKSFKIVSQDGKGFIRVFLKYHNDQEDRVINDLQRVSSPGKRVYVAKDKIPLVKGGMGIAILSTSKGILTDRESRKQNLGGEILCSIW
ncbi:MAG: 30S ribosomal protein S8 [Nitrospirae bacterium]|nr:30S ribosomal protein S8 [Nitrospirota bacterium]MBI3594618.1 30S ribosomal protein S8 [Nitrospirota bacterium]